MIDREKPKIILEDDREVFAIWSDSGDIDFKVGDGTITKILPYGEPGEFCMVPWFAIYEGDAIWCRVPAVAVVVAYRSLQDHPD